ncbi:hypothetical protein ACWCXE_34105 [Streptomyces sp. NPDC001780]
MTQSGSVHRALCPTARRDRPHGVTGRAVDHDRTTSVHDDT